AFPTRRSSDLFYLIEEGEESRVALPLSFWWVLARNPVIQELGVVCVVGAVVMPGVRLAGITECARFAHRYGIAVLFPRLTVTVGRATEVITHFRSTSR